MTKTFKYVDLFSGCGGLSLGLRAAGFKERLAVEKSEMPAETYYHNLIKPIDDVDEWKREYVGADLSGQVEKGLVVSELGKLLERDDLVKNIAAEGIDLVAGGPPCQGFSMAGRRNPDDIRNQLPWQFLEFVETVKPKVVIIENVSGMKSDFAKHGKRSPFAELQDALREIGSGYVVQPLLLNARHFGVPQNRPRLFLIGIVQDIASKLGITVSGALWSSADDDGRIIATEGGRPRLAPRRTHFTGAELQKLGQDADRQQERSVREALYDILDAKPSERSGAYQAQLAELDQLVTRKKTNSLKNHNKRRHSEKVKRRFSFYQMAAERGINKLVLGIPLRKEISRDARNSAIHASYPAPGPDGGNGFLEDIDIFVQHVHELATKKHSQRALRLHEPSPTVVSLPDDFVHPVEPRVPTVRELARFQSFPDTFEFRAKETTGAYRRRVEVPQYTQVGNAVPPLLAKALGTHLHAILAEARGEE
ncbi:DNA cytosine methyltransferase [Hoeflea sp.]|uniref:DNA cytosine methyltransferase n=1 Tax=Hoeflea sp. TaxID=1940281 RepID=UPI003A90E970